MQMLLDRSAEFGEHEGLGIIAGDVVPLTQGIRHLTDDVLDSKRRVAWAMRLR